MALTEDEVRRIRVVLTVEEAREKLNALRATKNTEMRTATGIVQTTVNAKYSTNMNTLQIAYNNAEAAMKAEFSK